MMVERHMIRDAAAIHYATAHEMHEAGMITHGLPGHVVPDVYVIPNEALEASVVSGQEVRGTFPDKDPEAPWVTTVCRFDRVKGLDILLDAMAVVKSQHRRFKLVLVGDGDPVFVREMKSRAEALGIAADILWLGYVDGAEKFHVLRRSDIFVLPSHFESFGIAAAEAMLCGVPVVVSAGVGLRVEIAASEAGIVADRSPQAIARAVITLLDSPSERQRMGSNGRTAAGLFSETEVIPRIVEMYSSILAGLRGEPAVAWEDGSDGRQAVPRQRSRSIP
jgi:glycosyltransferase involved in cell wall biosynthesis